MGENNLVYKVVQANEQQLNDLINTRYKNLKGKNNVVLGYLAINENQKILSHIIMEKKSSIYFKNEDCFIWNIFTLPELRKNGIASTLLYGTIKDTKELGIHHLIGSCTNTSAHMFWEKHNFCFTIYGSKIDNISNPNEHGNYPHMIFYRLNKTEKTIFENQKEYKIIEADKKQLYYIFDEYILDDGLKYFHTKREEIFGLAAYDEKNNMVGLITIYEHEMGSPLFGMQWMIPYVYIAPNFKRRGIGSALISEIQKLAKNNNIKQLTCMYINENVSKYLYKNNFDMCVHYIANSQNNGKPPLSAAIRIT